MRYVFPSQHTLLFHWSRVTDSAMGEHQPFMQSAGYRVYKSIH